MNKPELIIFDVDGLMLNTEFLWQKAWTEVGIKHDIPQLGSVFRKLVGISGKDAEAVYEKELHDVPERERILDETRIYGRKLVDENVGLMPYVNELLDLTDEMRIPRAIATTTDRRSTEQRLSALGLKDRFLFSICGDEVVRRKPDPEIYCRVLEKTGKKPEKCLVLEDTGYGVRAAAGAGIPVIMVPSINDPTMEERQTAYAVVENLGEVIRMLKENGI